MNYHNPWVSPDFFSTPRKIGIVSAIGIGDALVAMIVANNLVRQGHLVTLHHDKLLSLQPWFPGVVIKPFGSVADLNNNDLIVWLHRDEVFEGLAKVKFILKIKDADYPKDCSRVAGILGMLKQYFCLSAPIKDNGIIVRKGLIPRHYKKRVIIHPTSTDFLRRTWLSEKFIILAKLLISEGYQPVFVVSKAERAEWDLKLRCHRIGEGNEPSAQSKPVESKAFFSRISVQAFESLSDLAAYIYESDYFIGNDSGIGHLASNLGLPTLSIFSRKCRAILWHPDWAVNNVVLPSFSFYPRKFFKSLWKYFISAKKVFCHFKKLVYETDLIS